MTTRVVLVTGVPGSGKTTLGTLVARSLRVPFIARDDVRGGLLMSAGAWTDQMSRVPAADEAVERFLEIVEGLLARDVSCVVEHVVRSHRLDDLDRIRRAADCRVIMTSCEHASERLVRRNEADRLIANRAVLDALGLDSVAEHTALALERMRRVGAEMARDLPVPVLHVDTTRGYHPSIESVLEFAAGP